MDKQMKKRIQKYITWILLVSMVALLAAMPLLASQKQEAEGPQASILSGNVERKDIETCLVGGGVLSPQSFETLTIPASVKLTEYLVQNGDYVKQGDAVAKVDRVTVMSAISQVQEQLAEISEELEDVRDESPSGSVKAIAQATVKAVYAQPGDNVQDVMLEHGALAALSLDGMMAVRLPVATGLAGGDSVKILFGDGREVEGRVESNLDGILTVTVKDNDFTLGETVTVTTPEDDFIGEGQLYIHSQWNAVAYSGTVSKVWIQVEDKVNSGNRLFSLEDTGRTGEFDALCAKHREYTDRMLELFRMYQSETLTAPCDGIVSGILENAPFMLSAGGGWEVRLLANEPTGDADVSYVNFVGTVFAVGVDGLVMKMNPQPLAITDYADLGSVPMDPALMTEDVIYASQAPVFERVGDDWISVDAATILPGDVLLFAGDDQGNFVWVIRLSRAVIEQPTEPEETQPTEPEETVPEETQPEPSETPEETLPTEPEEEQIPTFPTFPGQGSIQLPQFNGNTFGGITGIPEQEEEDPILTDLTVATVTPQDSFELKITLDELDIGSVAIGQTASVTLDALKGETFEAHIKSISGTGINAGGNSKFTVTLVLDSREDMLPGMSASARIALSMASDVLCIPAASLADLDGKRVVYTDYDPENQILRNPVEVTTGVSDGEYVQILSGMEEGMTYFYTYYDTLVISSAPDKSMIPSFE